MGFHGRRREEEQTAMDTRTHRDMESLLSEDGGTFGTVEEDIFSETVEGSTSQVVDYRGFLASAGFSAGEIEVIIHMEAAGSTVADIDAAVVSMRSGRGGFVGMRVPREL